MSASFDPQSDSQAHSDFDSRSGTQRDTQFRGNGSSVFACDGLGGLHTVARAGVVNRTRRVVWQRAKVMQARRSHLRSLMVPLVVCSVLLILTVFAVWTGLYQYQTAGAVEAVQADVAAVAATDANNQFLVVLLWFVPVSIALLGATWFRRSRMGAESKGLR